MYLKRILFCVYFKRRRLNDKKQRPPGHGRTRAAFVGDVTIPDQSKCPGTKQRFVINLKFKNFVVRVI